MSRKEFLQRVESRLRDHKAQLRTAIESELRALSGEQERLVGDVVDLAAEDEAHEVAGGLAELVNEELVLVNEALERLQQGKYGVCEECGKNIPVARLQALPYSTACVHCQRQSEQSHHPRHTTSANWQLQAPSFEDSSLPPVEIPYERVA